MSITKDQVIKALDSLEAKLSEQESEDVSKASETGLDKPEGADLGNPAKEKLSDEAKKDAKKSEAPAEETPVTEAPASVAKSFGEEMPEEVQTKIDVSDFLKSLVDHTASTIDGLREFVAKSDLSHESRYAELAESVTDIQKSQAKIGVVLKAICERIGVIEKSPAHAPKAETVQKSEAPAERKFSSGLETEGNGEGKLFKSLNDNPAIAKAQIGNAICELVKSGKATDLDVIGFESGGHIRPEVAEQLKTVLN